jgi:Fe-S-cluster containining protein
MTRDKKYPDLKQARIFNDLGRLIATSRDAALITPSDAFSAAATMSEVIMHGALAGAGIVSKCPPHPGCFACCCELVEATGPEVFAASAYIQGELSRGDQRGIKRRLGEWLERTRALRGDESVPPREYMAEKIRCPFLDSRCHCTIYDARPFGCRLYISDQGPAECHDALEAGEAHRQQRPMVVEALVFALAATGAREAYLFPEAVAHSLGVLAKKPEPNRTASTDVASFLDELAENGGKK